MADKAREPWHEPYIRWAVSTHHACVMDLATSETLSVWEETSFGISISGQVLHYELHFDIQRYSVYTLLLEMQVWDMRK